MKHVHLCEMLMSLGHEVYCYGAKSTESDIPPCTEFIETHTVRDIARDYGDGDNRYELGYAWPEGDWRHDYSSTRKPSTLKFYNACIEAINKNKRPDDFLLMMQGYYHKTIRDAVGLYLNCEPGIGYRGSMRDNFRAFESHYIQCFAYGSENPFKCINGNYYDRVIPNYFDPNDFEFSGIKDDYYLYIGRMIQRKGVLTAIKACNAIGKKLILAGQGAKVVNGKLIAQDFTADAGTWEYVGFADVERRKHLMSRAIATFVPTEYLECFAGVQCESMLSGTPVITTAFGVFPGTIHDTIDGMFHLTDIKKSVGFKCNTLDDFVQAAKKSTDVDHAFVRKYGERFLMDNVKWEFQKWFEDLFQLYKSTDGKTKGWHYIGGQDG